MDPSERGIDAARMECRPTEEKLHSWLVLPTLKDFVAGTVAGVTITLVGHPFDTVKVRLQTQDLVPGMQPFRGGVDCAMRTFRNEGFLALYKGMSGPIITVPLINAVVFAVYEQGLNYFRLHPLNSSDPRGLAHVPTLTEISLAGGWAGLINSFIVGPMEMVKSRLQIQYESPRVRGSKQAAVLHGPWDVLVQSYRWRGLRGVLLGMNTTILREVPAYMAQFGTYELLKRLMTPQGKSPSDLGSAKLMAAGGVAGISAWLFSYPQDIIKSRIQVQRIGAPLQYPSHRVLRFDGGLLAAAREIHVQWGPMGFWRGIGPCMARAFPANAAGFLAYEMAQKLMRDPTPPCP
jgi:solute carrier family 25 carnitine/acylcarnitine transporter 20/29